MTKAQAHRLLTDQCNAGLISPQECSAARAALDCTGRTQHPCPKADKFGADREVNTDDIGQKLAADMSRYLGF